MKKILLVAGAALALAGCGEKGDFEKAINAKIGQTRYCFSLDNNNTSFPFVLPSHDLIRQAQERIQ